MKREAERIYKEVIYLPALLILALVVLMQKRRARSEASGAAEAPA